MNSIILYNASDFWRKHRSIGRFPDLAQLLFSKRSMNMCMSIEQRCIYVDRGKLTYSEKDLFQCHMPTTNLTRTGLDLRGKRPEANKIRTLYINIQSGPRKSSPSSVLHVSLLLY